MRRIKRYLRRSSSNCQDCPHRGKWAPRYLAPEKAKAGAFAPAFGCVALNRSELEGDLCAELQDARLVVAVERSETGPVVDVGVDTAEVRVVKHVESLGA